MPTPLQAHVAIEHDQPADLPEFEAIYDRYFRFVWSSARRLGVDPESIDDVVQEVFIVIHAKRDTIHEPSVLRSWIYGIVRRTVSNHRRARTRSALTSSLSDEERSLPSQWPGPLQLAEQSAQLELLSSLLSRLSEEKREVFVLAELEEMSAPEIADAIEVPLNTVYSRLRHARLELDAALARRMAEGKRSRRGMKDSLSLLRQLLEVSRNASLPPDGSRQRIWEELSHRSGADAPPQDSMTAAVTARRQLVNGSPQWLAPTAVTFGVGILVGVLHWTLTSRADLPHAPRPSTDSMTTTTLVVDATSPSEAPTLDSPPTESTPEATLHGLAVTESPTGQPLPSSRSKANVETHRSRLADEVALLSRATSALHAGRAQSALQTLAEHQRTFPAGSLTMERRAARAQALCQLGRKAEAEAELRQLPESSPQAALARRHCAMK